MKTKYLNLYVITFGMALAFSLTLIAYGVYAGGVGLMVGGLVLFNVVLWLPLAWFVAMVAKRLDALAETGNDWTPFVAVEKEGAEG